MKKYVLDYLAYINEIINNGENKTDYDRIIKNHLIQIEFIQHERLIHLIVTCLFSVVLFIVILGFVCFEKIIFLPLIILILVLIIPYIAHYYFLENNVQKMYTIYNRLCELSEKREKNEIRI